jgi:uncharacterized protein YyaL (SSP411 family)
MLSQEKTSNRLANEKSPYLLQHAHNPVDWHPWGNEAFEEAKWGRTCLCFSVSATAPAIGDILNNSNI